MRVVVAVCCVFALVGCQGTSDRQPATGSSSHSPMPSYGDPEAWEMGPDSFGPITATTTRAEAIATGAFKAAPSPCSGDLDWHSQTYKPSTYDIDGDGKPDQLDEDNDGKPDQVATKPLPSITMNYRGKGFAFVDPGADTAMEHGVKVGSSLKDLQAAFGARLSHDPRIGYFVQGKRSYLFVNMSNDDSKVVSFYMGAGKADGPHGVLAGRGGLC